MVADVLRQVAVLRYTATLRAMSGGRVTKFLVGPADKTAHRSYQLWCFRNVGDPPASILDLNCQVADITWTYGKDTMVLSNLCVGCLASTRRG